MSLFWTDCLARFESELPAQQFNAWIKSLRVESDEDGRRLRLFAPNGFILKWVRERYLDRVEALSRQFFKEPVIIDLLLDDMPSSLVQEVVINALPDNKTPPAEFDEESFSIVTAGLPEDSPDYDKTRLNPEFTFDTLVTGRSNDLARAAAQQVAINPGSSYNPLFIYLSLIHI